MVNDCSKHKKDVAGISDMHKLGEMIGDLNYQSLSELLINLAAKISKEAKKDEAAGRVKLAQELRFLSSTLYAAEQHALNSWLICKPFMNDKNKKP